MSTTYTATAETLTNGRRMVRVYADGVEVFAMGTKVAAYRYVHIQAWEHTADVAFRMGRNVKPVGARIDYGYCLTNVEITEA